MVNVRVKEVLTRNRLILLKNIVFCEELYGELSKQNVFPETFNRDIKVC